MITGPQERRLKCTKRVRSVLGPIQKFPEEKENKEAHCKRVPTGPRYPFTDPPSQVRDLY